MTPELSELAQREAAREDALKILTATSKSRAQLAERLLARGHAEQIVVELLDRFEGVGLLDDASLAAMIVRTRFTEKRQSRRAIAQELSRKGIPSEIAARALEQVDDQDESEAALDCARAQLRRTTKLDEVVRIRRALGALGRKGYSSSTAMSCIRQVLNEERAGSVGDDDWIDEGGI